MQKDQSCVISITLTPAQQVKLQRCRELLAAKLQQGHKAFTTVNYLEELMDFYLNKKDPCSPISKAEKVVIQPTSKIENTAIRSVSRRKVAEIKSTCKTESTILKPTKRQPSLKKQVFQKWNCCQFQDPLTKRTCGEKFQLEIEHLQPQWAGGLDHLENRTLLCRTHNQWKYRKQMGLH